MKTKLTDIIIIIQCLNEVFENGSTFNSLVEGGGV